MTNVTPDVVSSASSLVENRRQFLKMAGLGTGALLSTQLMALAAEPGKVLTKVKQGAKTGQALPPPPKVTLLTLPTENPITAKSFEHLQAGLEGISTNQIKQHIGLYQGYVKKANEIHGQLAQATPDVSKVNATYDPFRELLVEESYAMNGVIWHELYFDSLGGDHTAPSEFVKSVFVRHFGTWDGFINQLKAAGKAMRGWAIVAFNVRDNRIHLYGLDTHNQWVPAHVIPLVVLDVYEHAYMIDFGTNRGSYLDVFLNNLNWKVVEARLQTIPTHVK